LSSIDIRLIQQHKCSDIHLFLIHATCFGRQFRQFRYVDKILIVYSLTHTNIKEILDEFNDVTPNLEFRPEKEQNNTLRFLGITRNRCNAGSEWKFRISLYRKPATTDCIIPCNSCHPVDHRLASIRYLNHRLYTFALLPQDKEIQTQIIIYHHLKYQIHLNILDQVSYKRNKHSKNEESSTNKKDMKLCG
jgi:hypothetical protein